MSTTRSNTLARSVKAGVGVLLAGASLVAIAFLVVPHEAERLRANPTLGRLNDHPAIAVAEDTGEEVAGIDWEYWQGVNPDIVGWITIPDTPIDYPVVQASESDPTHYLNYDIFGEYNIYGCLYVDSACTTESANVVIFGHNMGGIDDSMFTALPNYLDNAYLAEHTQVVIQTPERILELEVRCAENVNPYSYEKQTVFSSVEGLRDYYLDVWKRANARSAESNEAEIDRLFTLITCDSGGATRAVVYAG